MKKIVSIRITVKGPDGQPMKNAKITLRTTDGSAEQTVQHGKQYAVFDGKKFAGKSVDLLVNGKDVDAGLPRLPVENDNGVTSTSVTLGTARRSEGKEPPPSHKKSSGRSKGPKHSEHDEDDDIVEVWVMCHGKPVTNASVEAPEFNDLEVVDLDGVAEFEPFPKRTKLIVTARGYKEKEVMLPPNTNAIEVELEPTSVAAKTNWVKVAWFSVPLAVVAFLLFAATKFQSAQTFLGGGGGQGLTANLNDPVTKGMFIASSVVIFVVALVGRIRIGQVEDIIAAIICLGLMALSEVLSTFHVEPATLAVLPEPVQKGLGFLDKVGLVSFWIGIAVLYAAALANTPDLTTPGFVWDFVGLLVYTSGFRMGLSKDVDPMKLVLMLKLFAAAHFFADILQLPNVIRRKKVEHKLELVGFAVITLGLYGLLRYFLPTIPASFALGSVGIGAGLLAEILEEVTKTTNPDKMVTGLRVIMKFVKTNKADGVLIMVTIATIFGLFGIR